jgi:DNA-binding protein H-NS
MAAAPANPSATPEATNALAMEAAAPPKTVSVVGSTISVGPSQASAAPMAPGVEALEGVRPKTSKSARQAERAEKREAQREVRRQKAIEREIRRGGGDPEDMVASVKASPRERNTRRARNAVPDEVIAAVEEATSGRGRRGGQMVTIGSANGGQRIYLVPREQISRW